MSYSWNSSPKILECRFLVVPLDQTVQPFQVMLELEEDFLRRCTRGRRLALKRLGRKLSRQAGLKQTLDGNNMTFTLLESKPAGRIRSL